MGLSPFEWNRITHYIEKKDLDLSEIDDSLMENRIRHFRQLIELIEKQKFHKQTDPIKESPLRKFGIRHIDRGLSKGNQWKRTPWIFRRGVETLFISLSVIILIFALPRLLTLYEERKQKQLDAFDLADVLTGEGSQEGSLNEPPDEELSSLVLQTQNGSSMRESQTSTKDPTLDHALAQLNVEIPLDITSLKIEEGADLIEPDNLQVGYNERWRFEIKTDTPTEIQPNVVDVLRGLGLDESVEGFTGRVVPGGVQFEMVVNRDQVIPIMKGVMQLAANISGGKLGSSFKTFTWYRTRARGNSSLKRDQAQVQIWLAQI